MAKLDLLRSNLIAYETGERTETGWDYVEQWEDVPRQMTASTLDKMGIVVPPDTFRLWSETELQLKGIRCGESGRLTLEQDEAIGLYRLAQEFLAEGKAGNVLQIGKNLWFFGETYAELAYPVLDAAYRALGREALAEILQFTVSTGIERVWILGRLCLMKPEPNLEVGTCFDNG